ERPLVDRPAMSTVRTGAHLRAARRAIPRRKQPGAVDRNLPGDRIVMPVTALGRCSAATWPDARPGRLAIPSAAIAIVIVAVATLGLAFRVSALSAYGFSEDEVNKLHAIEAYRHGEFSANAEHPMLMKLAMWGSVALADGWS